MLICCDFKVIVTCVSDPKLYGGGFDVFPIQETTVIYWPMFAFGGEKCFHYMKIAFIIR